MANLEAVQRASQGGGVPPQAPQPDPMAQGGQPPDPSAALVGELDGVRAFIEQQIQSGNPAATQAMQSLQQLAMSLAEMSGAGAPPGAEPTGQPGGQVPIGNPQNATVL